MILGFSLQLTRIPPAGRSLDSISFRRCPFISRCTFICRVSAHLVSCASACSHALCSGSVRLNNGASLPASGTFWIFTGFSCFYLSVPTRFSVWLQRIHPLQVSEICRPSLSHLLPWESWMVLCNSLFSVQFSLQITPDYQHNPVLQPSSWVARYR